MWANSKQKPKALWIGDLESWMDQAYLESLINSLGYSKQLASIKLIKDKATGSPLKYGFLFFVSHESANNFYTNYNNSSIPNANKQFKLNWAAYGGVVKPAPTTQTKPTQQDMQIYVGDIDAAATEHKLLEFFRAKYPSAFSSKIITDTTTKLSKGYGFVKFTNHDEAHKAIAETNGQSFMGKTIKVSTAYMKNKDEMPEDNQELEAQVILRQKLYNQYYSMLNDPQMKAEYQKQLLKTFGSEQHKKASLKQSLGEVRGLSYKETQQSEQLLEIIPRAIHNRCRYATQQKIYL